MCSIPLIILLALLWTNSNRSMSFLGWLQHCRWSLSRGAESLISPAAHTTLDAAQATLGFLGWEGTLLDHVQPLIHQHLPSLAMPWFFGRHCGKLSIIVVHHGRDLIISTWYFFLAIVQSTSPCLNCIFV